MAHASAQPKKTPNMGGATPNTELRVEVSAVDLPLQCPIPGTTMWNAHPRVYLPLEGDSAQMAACPYCGTEYLLVK